MEHFIKMLKAGGRAGVVIKNTFLSNTNNASVALYYRIIKDVQNRRNKNVQNGVLFQKRLYLNIPTGLESTNKIYPCLSRIFFSNSDSGK